MPIGFIIFTGLLLLWIASLLKPYEPHPIRSALENVDIICMPGQVQMCSPGYARIVLPSIPRSANTFMRILLENATGIATEAVYEEKGTWENRTEAYARPCGLLGDCAMVRRGRGAETIIVKTHFPFMKPELEPNACVSAVIMPVRHPLDNYLAWAHYLSLKHTNSSLEDFETFGKRWESHITFWHQFASSHNIPLLQYRFEDLVADNLSTLDMVLPFVSGDGIGKCPSRVGNSVTRPLMLKNLKEIKAWGLFTQHEVQQVLAAHKDMLVRFRYPSTWTEVLSLAGRLPYQTGRS